MTTHRNLVRISDLSQPRLNKSARQAIIDAQNNPVKLTEEAVLEAAAEATGLDVPESDDFRKKLRSFLDSIADDSFSTALTRADAFQECVHFAATRFQLETLLSRHREIRNLEINDPIVIVGPWRSGTTHLQGLLAADSRAHTLRIRDRVKRFLFSESIAQMDGHSLFSGQSQDTSTMALLPSILRTDILPYQALMHELELDDVVEDFMLYAPDFPNLDLDGKSLNFDFMKMMLKALQWQWGPGRWVLKFPLYCTHLEGLNEAFPGATVVIVHRDPISIVQSIATGNAYSLRLVSQEIDTESVLSNAVKQVENVLTGIVNGHHKLPASDRIDVFFGDLNCDNIKTIEKIYEVAGVKLDSEERSRMNQYINSHQRYARGKIAYDLHADFNADPIELRKRFSFYCDRFPVEFEVV